MIVEFRKVHYIWIEAFRRFNPAVGDLLLCKNFPWWRGDENIIPFLYLGDKTLDTDDFGPRPMFFNEQNPQRPFFSTELTDCFNPVGLCRPMGRSER